MSPVGSVVSNLIVSSKKSPDETINAMLREFVRKNGASLPNTTKQRRYCHLLKQQYGDRVLDLVKFSLGVQGMEYAPLITTPQDLYYKAPKVIAFGNKLKQNSKVLHLE